MSFFKDTSKSKKGASVSREFALFNRISGIYLTYHLLKIRIINIEHVIYSLEVEL